VGKDGYQTAWKHSVSALAPAAGFVLHPSVQIKVDGDTLSVSISGDEFMAGDDVPFGGLCLHTPCKVIMFGESNDAPRPAEVHLRWNDPTRQLALYRFGGDPDAIPALGQPVQRYGGTSAIVALLNVSGYFDALASPSNRVRVGRRLPTCSRSN
jgi:hypothetical protein